MSIHWAEGFSIGLPAVVSVVSAAFAAFEARKARASELEAERLRRLEQRVAERKYEIYRPMIETWADVLAGESQLSGQELVQRVSAFSRWIAIFGSDDAVLAFRNMMTTGYNVPQAPPPLAVRMYLEFVIAARRDMGDIDTRITPIDLWAHTVKDAFDNRNSFEDMTLPLEQVYGKYLWTPPWQRSVVEMNDDREEAVQGMSTPTTT